MPSKYTRDEILLDVTASLAAAVYLLEALPGANKRVASDKMFETMLADYRKSLARARKHLRECYAD